MTGTGDSEAVVQRTRATGALALVAVQASVNTAVAKSSFAAPQCRRTNCASSSKELDRAERALSANASA